MALTSSFGVLRLFSYVLGSTIICSVISYENGYGPGYGSDWVYFVDENSSTRILNFSTLPPENHRLILGDAHFYLYTRENEHNPELLIIPKNDKKISSTYFNPNCSSKILTHGWLSKGTTEWLIDLKDALLRKDDSNVIIVDWRELADNPVYIWSALCTRYVGKRVAQLIGALVRTYGVEGRSMHLIGHSLGAQVMGYAGMFSSENIFRITGLDPARPMFEVPNMGPNYKLEKSDAVFVDIIHTSGGVLGYKYSHGHADFYPNKGTAPQPGCEGVQESIESCSHARSYIYFEESIESEIGFVAYPCESWEKFANNECRDNSTYMGYPADSDSVGNYYLYTKNESKYAMG